MYLMLMVAVGIGSGDYRPSDLEWYYWMDRPNIIVKLLLIIFGAWTGFCILCGALKIFAGWAND
jgi:hypothetical protein